MSNKAKSLILVSCLLAGIAFVFATFQSYAQAQPATCRERLRNGGFETDEAWTLPVTVYRAAYSTEQQHTGSRSVRTGIVNLEDNVFSYSSVSQTVQLPTGI